VIVAIFEWLHHAEFPPSGSRFLTALAITAGFALLAWFAGGVNLSGALAGSAVAFIMAVRDLRMFLALLIVFAVTLLATRVGYARKQQLRTAEPAGGRTAAQAISNLGIAALVVAIAGAGWPVLALAALAEAAGDTSSSEIGMAFPGKTLLVTNFKSVPAGTDGGVSLFGTIAALAGAGSVAVAAVATGLVPVHAIAAIILAGFFGTMIDSLLGAVFGSILGILVGNSFSLVLNTGFVFPWVWLFWGMFICTIVGILAGLYPSLKASRMNPIQALRYE